MRIALGLEYAGTHYHGWQSQEKLNTVQGQLEAALSRVANQQISVVCAGRTDAGVHALGQIVHFDTFAQRDNHSWINGVNSYLPSDIRVQWAIPSAADFHARYSATARRYHYFIHNHTHHSALWHNQLSWYRWPLDHERMAEAAHYLLGEHDFSAYRGIDCQAKTPFRCVHFINISRLNNLIKIDIKANAFLHHMVRNIAGVLIEIGRGKRKPIWAKEVLLSKQRRRGGVTAHAAGLYLIEVDYPQRYQLPLHPRKMIFI
jgi:tRNA pseudouridine38-40 synthase